MEQWRIDYNAAMGQANALMAAGNYAGAVAATNRAASLAGTTAASTAAVNLRQQAYAANGPGIQPSAANAGNNLPPGSLATDAPTSSGGGGTGGGGTGSTAATVTPPAAFSASQILDNILYAALGISGLGSYAANLKNRGATETEIVYAIRFGTDTSDAGKAVRAKYLEAFPQMDVFLKERIFTGADPERQYMAYRNTIKEAAARFNVPERLVSSDEIAKYIGGRNSADEIVNRMATAATAIATTPVETYRKLQEYYGITNGDLMAFYLDTDRTESELQKRYTAARIGTEAARQSFGVDANYAENLAQRGVTVDEATRGFGQAYQQKGFTGGFGETIGQTELIDAQFGDAVDSSTIARIAASRTGRFESAGSYAGTKAGVSGIGSASS